jgi:hypothetical protein
LLIVLGWKKESEVYKLDSNGNPDYCRVEFTKPDAGALEQAKVHNLKVNALMAELHKGIRSDTHPEVKRLLTAAMMAMEESSMWAVKAMTSEHWGVAHGRVAQSPANSASP